jgi:membrane-associated protein
MWHLLGHAPAGGFLDPTPLLQSVGAYSLIVVVVIVFIETGLLFPFLPGDSLVFAAAIVIGSIGIPLWLLILVVGVSASLGSQTSFALGRRFGPRLFKRDARVFKTAYRDEAHEFFTKYGPGSIMLARFVPVVRTYISPIAGSSSMPLRVFLPWNIVSAFVWAIILTLAGFWLGKIPVVANNVDLIVVAIVVVSVLPIAIGILRRRIRSRRAE